jgi:predicted DNA binding CopG/RHH family protein
MRSIDRLATFWDTHDLMDFEDELEKVTESTFASTKERLLTVRLSPDEIQSVKRIARSKRTKSGLLVRKWIRERIRMENAGTSPKR